MSSTTTIYTVCVVGAGMWGSSAAYHLSLIPGNKVCLVGPSEPLPQEYAQRTIFGSHYDEARITNLLNTGYFVNIGTIAKRAYDGYAELEGKEEIPIFKQCASGNFGPAGSDYIAESRKSAEIHGVEHTLLNRDQLKERYPYIDIQEGRQCVLQLPKPGILNPRKYVQAQKKAARLHGCLVLDDIIDHMTDNQLEDGSRLIELATESGEVIQARKVLLCMGAFTNFKCLLPKHLCPAYVLTPEQTLRVELTPDDAQLYHDMPTLSAFTRNTNDTDCYVVPPVVYPDRKPYIKIGHGYLDTGALDSQDEIVAWFRSNGNSQVKETLMRLLSSLIPDIKPKSTVTDTCITMNTPTGKPYLDMLTPRIGLLTGGNGYGAKLSYEIGRIGAKMIMKGQWDYDLPQDEFKVQFKSSTTKT